VTAFVFFLAVKPGGLRLTTWIDDLGQLCAALAAAVSCLIVARRRATPARRAWSWIGASALSWAAGQAIWSWYGLVRGIAVPFPSAADIGFLTAVPLELIGILSFPHARESMTSRTRTVFDGLIVGASLLLISWALVLGPVYRGSRGGILAQALSLAYPLGDVVVASVVLTMLTRARASHRCGLGLLAVGMLGLTVADSSFAYLTQNGTYGQVNPTDAGWVAGYLLVALAALWRWPAAAPAEEDGIRPWQAGVPLVAVGGALATALGWSLADRQADTFLVADGIVMGLLVLGSGVLTMITQGQLYDGQRRLVRKLTAIDRSRLDFFAIISHELRTPLTSITASLELLADSDAGPVPDEQRRLLEMIRRNAARLRALVEDMLTLSRVDDELPGFTMADVAVADIIESACATVASAAAQKGVELGIELQDGTEVIPGDRRQLDRVMLNLISNAVKFTPPEGSVLARSRREGDDVVISVIDTGIGIPEDEQQMLFTRFFRASNVRETAPGSGLGLAIAHRIVAHHGGSLTMTSRESIGTTFWVRLPVKETAVVR